MGDRKGDRPPMRPGVVGKGIVRATRASYLRRQVGDVRRPNFDDCRRPNFDVDRRPDSDKIRRPDSAKNLRPDSGEIRRPDHADFLQAAPVDVARPISADGVVGTDDPQDRRAVLLRASTRAWVAKPDDDLRPMILLEEEALAAWMMKASFCLLRLDF